MASISLCLITKDSARVLTQCLVSISEAIDELIVADLGSQDETRKIALNFGARWFEAEQNTDRCAAQNFALHQAKCDYLMWMHPEDRLKPGDLKRFCDLKRQLCPGITGVSMHYMLADGKCAPNPAPSPCFLARRDAHPLWRASGYGTLDYEGYTLFSDLTLCRAVSPP